VIRTITDDSKLDIVAGCCVVVPRIEEQSDSVGAIETRIIHGDPDKECVRATQPSNSSCEISGQVFGCSGHPNRVFYGRGIDDRYAGQGADGIACIRGVIHGR
jgi:hypothetical protein